MSEQLLTLRRLYRLLTLGVENPAAPLPFLKREAHFTQADFWLGFLTAAIPEPAVKPWFYNGAKRPRALSNLMNRTVPRSLPLKLQCLLEEQLSPEKLLYITLWTASVLNRSIHADVLHGAIACLEDQLHAAGDDLEFDALYPFFVSLRPGAAEKDELPVMGHYLQAVFRFAMLGLHAAYGDQMLSSPVLTVLRSCNFCDPRILWQAARDTAPSLPERDYPAFIRTMGVERDGVDSGEAAAQQQLIASEMLSVRDALAQAASRLPHGSGNAGWYVVANWMDNCVNLNDRPQSTYDGAEELGTIPNGRLIYVLSAPGYRGLHSSSGIWGKVFFRDQMGYVPMNLLVLVDTDMDKI